MITRLYGTRGAAALMILISHAVAEEVANPSPMPPKNMVTFSTTTGGSAISSSKVQRLYQPRNKVIRVNPQPRGQLSRDYFELNPRPARYDGSDSAQREER